MAKASLIFLSNYPQYFHIIHYEIIRVGKQTEKLDELFTSLIMLLLMMSKEKYLIFNKKIRKAMCDP